MDCLFCKIAAGEIPSAKVYEDDRVLVFKDINPVAPVHLLAIPKEHIQSVDAVDASNCELVGYIFTVIAKVAKEQGLTNGYRVASNIGADGGQSVPHLHFHILGGKHGKLMMQFFAQDAANGGIFNLFSVPVGKHLLTQQLIRIQIAI